jgi:hypothetical protein
MAFIRLPFTRNAKPMRTDFSDTYGPIFKEQNSATHDSLEGGHLSWLRRVGRLKLFLAISFISLAADLIYGRAGISETSILDVAGLDFRIGELMRGSLLLTVLLACLHFRLFRNWYNLELLLVPCCFVLCTVLNRLYLESFVYLKEDLNYIAKILYTFLLTSYITMLIEKKRLSTEDLVKYLRMFFLLFYCIPLYSALSGTGVVRQVFSDLGRFGFGFVYSMNSMAVTFLLMTPFYSDLQKERGYLSFILVFFGAILTGMKGAIYGAILIPLMMNFRGIKGLARQVSLWLFIAVLAVYALSLPAFQTLAADFYFSWLGFFDLKRDELFNLLTSNRLSYYENTFSYMFSKGFDPITFLFGGGYPLVLKVTLTAEVDPLDVLLRFGAVSMVAIYFIYGKYLVKAWNSRDRTRYGYSCFWALLFALGHSVLAGYFLPNAIASLFTASVLSIIITLTTDQSTRPAAPVHGIAAASRQESPR